MAENMRTLSNSRTMSQPTRKLGHKVSSLSIQSQQTTVFVESHEAGYVTRPYRFLVQVWRRNRDCRRGVSAPPRRTGVSISFQIGENVNTKMFRRIRISYDLPIMISSHLFDPTIGKIIQNGIDQILTKLKVYFKKNLYQQHENRGSMKQPEYENKKRRGERRRYTNNSYSSVLKAESIWVTLYYCIWCNHR